MAEIYDPKGLMKLEFRCPQCGGKMFGTTNASAEDAEGHCNSYNSDGSRCGYKWERSKDEELNVFVKKPESNDGREPTAPCTDGTKTVRPTR